MKHRVLVFATIATIVAVYCQPAMGDPAFTIDPNPALTGYGDVNSVSFSYLPAGPDQAVAWDLNGDGKFDDAFGPDASKAYGASGTVLIGVRVTDSSGTSTAFKTLDINGPSTSFQIFPDAPVVGQQVTFVYSPRDPIDPSDGIQWDLNGDGAFGDANGATTFRVFTVPGTYPVGLRVTDHTTSAVSTGVQLVSVSGPAGPTSTNSKQQLRLMSPFPVVRISGRVSSKGARIKHLTIRAPFGSTVMIRCRGRGCPFRRKNQTLALAGAKTPSKTIRVKKLEHRLLRGGTSLKILISRQGEIGKYTRFKIVTGKAPIRTDLCLAPGSTRPEECPST